MKNLPPDLRPNLLCIGAAKTGTTWLATVLSDHPDIFVHPQKELNALHYANLEQRLGEYAAYFERGRAAKIRSDFSVRYLISDNASRMAAKLCPDAKLLLVVRNPVDQVQSHYWHLRRQNFHQREPVMPAPDIFEALEQYPLLLKEPALYGKHAHRWLQAFPRDQLHIIDSLALRSELPVVMDELCDFLGVARRDFSEIAARTTEEDGRAGVQPRRGVAGRVFPSLYVAATRGPYMWLKRAFGVRAADRVKRVLRLRQTAEKVFFNPGYPKLEGPDRERMFEMFRDDIASFQALFPAAAGWSAA